MKISASTIREILVLDPTFISPMPEDRLNHPFEGSKVDLTLNSVFTLNRSTDSFCSFMGINLRRTPPTIELQPELLPISPSMPRVGQGWMLGPGYYLLQTVEKLNMPPWLVGVIKERTTVFRNGSIIRVTDADPGYCGHITAGLFVPPGSALTLEKEVRFLSIKFEPIIEISFVGDEPDDFYISLNPENNDPYKGIWGGNKNSTEGIIERGY